MRKKITQVIFIAMVTTIGYTNLQAQNNGVNVIDHKGTKRNINKVNQGKDTPSSNLGLTKPVKGDIYRQLEPTGGNVKISYVYNGTSWVPITSPAAAAVTGTEGSVFFADTAANGGAPTENNANFFWDNTNKRLGIGNKAPRGALDVTGYGLIDNTFVSNGEIIVGFEIDNNKNTGIKFNSTTDSNQEAGIIRTEGENGDFYIINIGLGNFRIWNDNTERLLINQNGYVGINTSGPTQRLDVSGGVRVRSLTESTYLETTDRVVVADNTGVLKKSNIPLPTVGDIKSSLQTKDHNGWILLNGRDLSGLNPRQIAAAKSVLGRNVSRLPQTSGNGKKTTTYLGDIDGKSSTVGTIGGNTDNIWAASDLPKLDHKHEYTFYGKQNNRGGTVPESKYFFGLEIDGSQINGGAGYNKNIDLETKTTKLGSRDDEVYTNNRTLDVNHFVYLGL